MKPIILGQFIPQQISATDGARRALEHQLDFYMRDHLSKAFRTGLYARLELEVFAGLWKQLQEELEVVMEVSNG